MSEIEIRMLKRIIELLESISYNITLIAIVVVMFGTVGLIKIILSFLQKKASITDMETKE